MLLSRQSLQRLLSRSSSKFAQLGSVLLMGVSAGVFGHATSTLAADRVVLRYGIFQETFFVEDMKTFAETGELSRLRQFQLRVGGADPEVLRGFLNQKLPVDFLVLDRGLNSMPGEFLLNQLGQVVYNRHRVAPIQSLRSALVLSARDGNSVSMLEFLQNYPLPVVYIDGKKIAEVGQKVGNTREKARGYLTTMKEAVEQILNRPVCACDSDPKTAEEP